MRDGVILPLLKSLCLAFGCLLQPVVWESFHSAKAEMQGLAWTWGWHVGSSSVRPGRRWQWIEILSPCVYVLYSWKAIRKLYAAHIHLMIRQKHRNRRMCRSLPGFGLDFETQLQFLNSTSEVWMSNLDRMEETNVFANWEKEGFHGNASFPFLCHCTHK